MLNGKMYCSLGPLLFPFQIKLKYNFATFFKNSSPYKIGCATEIGLINITSDIRKNFNFLVH